MTDQFYIKRGDTSPAIRREFTDDDGNPIDLTGATVRFSMGRNRVAKVSRQPCVVDKTGEIWSAVYPWKAGDTDEAGTFSAEFEITYPGDAVETAPNAGYIFINITEDIA